MSTQLEEFGALVRQRRKEKGFSQEQLAVEVGITRTYLSQIEQGSATNLSLRLSKKLRETLNLITIQEQKTQASQEHPSLRAFAEAENLTNAEVLMLSHLSYRGKRPETIDQWRFLYSLIKTTIENY